MKIKTFIITALTACAMTGCNQQKNVHVENERKADSILPTDYGACVICNGEVDGINIDEAYAMHSVMKFPQALFVADCLKRQATSLDDSILVKKDELMQETWSPMLKMFDIEKKFSIAELLQLSLQQSDNNACDLLFERFGGPEQVENYMGKLGFANIRMRWTEREMRADHSHTNLCTPREICRLFEWFLAHKTHDEYLSFIWQTMVTCQTGTTRLPAAIPECAMCVHKTGTGFTNPDGTMYRNDAGIITLPDGRSIILAIFVPLSKEESDIAVIAKPFIDKVLEH